MKKQFLFFLLFALFLGKKEYARDTVAVIPSPAFTQDGDARHMLSATAFVPSVAEVHTGRLDVFSHTRGAKKTTGTSVSFYNIRPVAVKFLHLYTLPRFVKSTTSYLDFIFPFYCFW